MRRIIPLLALLAGGSGCFLFEWIWRPGSEHGAVEEPEPKPEYAHVPTAWGRWLYGTGTVGQWATYCVNESEIELACVGETADGKWFEVREGKTASAQFVSKGGRVLRAFYAEEPYAVAAPQEIASTPADLAAPGFERVELPRISESVENGHAIERYEDDLGFSVTVESEWSASVPGLYAERHGAGLVRRAGPKGRVELAASGADATPRLKIP